MGLTARRRVPDRKLSSMFPIQTYAAILAAAGGLWFSPAPVLAQAPSSDCILDRCQDRLDRQQPPPPRERAAPLQRQDESRASEVRRDSGFRTRSGANVAPGNFDFYVLALSWSSGFCELQGRDRARRQCESGADLGFVVHGLWPQYERGFPSDCQAGTRTPSRMALDSVRGLFPDEGLARYEWRKHGTCSGLSPTDYFAAVRRAREAIEVPAQFKDLREPLQIAANDVLRAFTQANARLRPGMLAISCPKGILQEVRICMSKDLRDFRPCPEVASKSCRGRNITVPPIL
jgi:ribonuclease T2